MGQAAETLKNAFWFDGNDTPALLLMAAAMGLKDRYTLAHAHRVAEYAKRLAVRAGLAMAQVLQISMGGMLHDVGKLALSDKIFSNNNAFLNEEMLKEVHSHPLIGATLLQKITEKKAILDAVLFHHERIDGSGYPFGLKENEIPLSARIVSIADCFDAITTDRPYQRRKGCRVAMNLLTDTAGTNFSPDLVRLFIQEIRTNGMVRDTQISRVIL